MSKVDWSKAPEGAQFYAGDYFVKVDKFGDILFFQDADCWWESACQDINVLYAQKDYEPRPKEWPSEQRIEQIGQNGATGEHYEAVESTQSDLINNPKHYQLIGGLEAIDVIAMTMTKDQFFGYCLGNILKYRLRNGKKGSSIGSEDLDKANKYERLFEDKKHLCR